MVWEATSSGGNRSIPRVQISPGDIPEVSFLAHLEGTQPNFLQIGLFWVFLHNYAPVSFISKNGPLARRRHHWRRACVCRRQYFWRAYVRCRRDLESTWQIPRCHRSWRRGRRPVNDAYLGAKIYGAEVPAYK
jgi:hypothetical protein